MFEHMYPAQPNFFKEQIQRLEIAVHEAGLPKGPSGRLGKLSEKTELILACLQDSERPLFSDEVAELTGLDKDYCRRQLSHYLARPETYQITSKVINRRRAYSAV